VQKGLAVILSTVLLDSIGMSLVMPIIPSLLREVGHTSEIGWSFGLFASIYALFQFVFSPILGVLSDRFGRRPVLLCSLAGAAVDYVFMAFAPTFALLVIGRAVAGMTGASMAVAGAYIADVTPEEQRARRFGWLSACFGMGFVAGPVLGGWLGEWWVRAPFLAAAGLNAINLAVAFFALPESRRGERTPFKLASLNPLGPMRWALGLQDLLPLFAVLIVLTLVGTVGGTIWVLYGEDKFQWTPKVIGFSLAAFGLFHALSQAFLAGPISERWGERWALTIGVICDASAYLLIAFATKGWMGFVLIPLLCMGGIGGPAIQSLLSRRVGEEHQGRLQGVMASLASLISIFGPLVISLAYFATRGTFPGFVWVAAAVLYFVCLPVLFSKAMDRPAPNPA
jgi:DHA1 family tetracycline resistance protein-like MFS transporter